MDWFFIIGILALGTLFISFTAYSMLTKSIIKQQERENARLRSEIRRLKAELRGANAVKQLEFPKAEPRLVKYRDFLDIE